MTCLSLGFLNLHKTTWNSNLQKMCTSPHTKISVRKWWDYAALTENPDTDNTWLYYNHWKVQPDSSYISPVTLFCSFLSPLQVLFHQHQFSGHLQQEEQPVQQTTQTCLKVQQVTELIKVQHPQFMSMYKREKDADNKLTFVQSTHKIITNLDTFKTNKHSILTCGNYFCFTISIPSISVDY